jgi:hypothetical protein
MRQVIRNFDEWLARKNGIFPYSQDAGVIMRINLGKAPRDILLPGETIPARSPVIEVHLWNARFPKYSERGPDVRWGLQVRRGLQVSLEILAGLMRQDPCLIEAKAVGGVTVLFAAGSNTAEEKLFLHFGYSTFPYHGRLGKFSETVENLYSLALMWAYNPPSARGRNPLDLARSEFWMSRRTILERYAPSEEA